MPTYQEWPVILTGITGLIGAIGALLTVLLVQSRKAKAEAERTRAETREILDRIDHKSTVTVEQVKNSHVDSNLRDDIDKLSRLLEQVHGLAARTDQQMTVVAAEHRALRQRVDRLDDDKHDTHKELYDRLRVIEARCLGWTGRRGRRRADETGEDDAV